MQPEPFFYIITITVIVSLIYFKKFKGTKYVYFSCFIYFTFIIDKLNYLNRVYEFISNGKEHNNIPILNTYIIATFYFFFWFYKQVFHQKKNQKIMNAFIGLFTVFIGIEFLIFKTNFFTNFLARTAVFGSILLVITLVLVTIEFLQNQKMVENIERSFLFWITLGCFLFYVGVIPILISSKFHLFQGVFKYILVILNSFAHLSFIIGYMISKREYNY